MNIGENSVVKDDNPFVNSNMFNSFNMGANNNSLSFQVNEFEKCNSDIGEIQKRLSEIVTSFDNLVDIHSQVNKVKQSISDGIIKEELFSMHKEISELHEMTRNVSDCVIEYVAHNKKFLEESKSYNTKIINENNGIYNLTIMASKEVEDVYRKMHECNQQIANAGMDSFKLIETYSKKFTVLNNNIDDMNILYSDYIKQMKSQNQYRLTMIFVFMVICGILFGLSIALIVIFR